MPLSKLSYQVAQQFTYYHELGHLFQFSGKINNETFEEKSSGDDVYSLERHKLEINADVLASIAIASHLQQYCEQSFGSYLRETFIMDTIAINCACLLYHISSFSSDFENLYIEEKTHPHPFLRMFNVALNISIHLNNSSLLRSRGINIEPFELFSCIIDMTKTLEQERVFTSTFGQSIIQFSSEKERIVHYLASLNQFNVTGYANATDIWNLLPN